MLLTAIALILAAQDAGSIPRERGAGIVVMLGQRMPEEGVPELREQRGGRVTLSIGEARPAGEATRAADGNQVDFELIPGTFRPADEIVIARAVRSAKRVTFGAGSLREWYLQLFPNRHESELVHALLEARRFGTTIVGRGDGAALLAGATVVADETELGEPESNPRKLGSPRCVWGMAYEPRVIVDFEARAQGSFERLLGVMLAEHLQLGAWIADDAALIGDVRAEALTCRGSRVVVLDLRGARHVQRMLLDAHVSILLDGDAWIERSRGLESRDGEARTTNTGLQVEREMNDAFDVAALCEMLAKNAKNQPETLVLRDERRTLTLTFDADAALIARTSTSTATCSRARLDVQFEH